MYILQVFREDLNTWQDFLIGSLFLCQDSKNRIENQAEKDGKNIGKMRVIKKQEEN